MEFIKITVQKLKDIYRNEIVRYLFLSSIGNIIAAIFYPGGLVSNIPLFIVGVVISLLSNFVLAVAVFSFWSKPGVPESDKLVITVPVIVNLLILFVCFFNNAFFSH